ncbi:hypothetical protein IAU60_006111 [Kwoniella sp. DSM 27419]
MPSSQPAAHKKGGVRSHVTSPSPAQASPLPRLKLKFRPTSPSSASTSTGRPKPSASSSSRPLKTYQSDESSSDLTPAEDEDEEDDDDFDESLITPRKGLHKGRNLPSVQGHTGQTTSSATKKTSHPGKDAKSNTKPEGKVAGTGNAQPGPSTVRDKKRAHKLEEVERRRARDAKFDMDLSMDSDDFEGTPPPPALPVVDDGVSSYGDDESDRDNLTEDDLSGIPEALLGHEIEDLNYGAGHDADIEKQPMAYWDETSSDEEEEQVFINQLSGSELDIGSQSSMDGESDDSMSDSEYSSSSDDGLDEFGFPIPTASQLFPIDEDNTDEDPGLVLMENWDGQFVLVQPRQERSRSRHRGDRGSRTNGSVSGSTTISGTDQQGLLIDPDAGEGEFDSDDSYWSGMSDEDDGGDTTDSMAEEDMPMLDSPALNELMEAQMAEAVLRMAVENGEMSFLENADIPLLADGDMPMADPGPSIVVTDATGADVHTPALSTTSSNGPVAGPPSVAPPQTPAPASAPPAGPIMGTFHPATDDPAQHCVIDGSGVDTKSPFTHRRRSRRGRDAASIASSKRSQEEKKRKASANDPFSPASQHFMFGLGTNLSKKARYSSIPGHPRFIAARRAAEALVDPHDRETTPTDSDEMDPDAFSLEDMLETSVLMHELEEQGHHTDAADAEHLRHMIRFDRVGVSTYLRRNFGATASGEILGAGGGLNLASPSGGRGSGMSAGFGMGGAGGLSGPSMEDTLVGPMGGRMLISPVLAPVNGAGGESRKDRRKRRRAAAGAAHVAAAVAADVAVVEPITSQPEPAKLVELESAPMPALQI